MRIAALLLVAIVGCTPPDRGDESSLWFEETPPNGAVRITNAAEGLWSQVSPWRLVPDLSIGDMTGPASSVFGWIPALEVGQDGRLYVIDEQADELRIFSPTGDHMRTVGGTGQGPGEFVQPNGLLWIARDTLLVVDQNGDRYTVLTSDGDYVESIPRQLRFFGRFSGGYDAGRVYEYTAMPSMSGPAQPVLFGVAVRALAPGGSMSRPDTIILPVSHPIEDEFFNVRFESGGMSFAVPYAPKAVYRPDGRGSIWAGHGSEFRIVQLTFDGDTVREIILDAVPDPVSPAEIAEFEGGDLMARVRGRGGSVDLSRIPEHKPFLDDLYVDPEGFLWVGVPTTGLTSLFAVFGPQGRFLGRLEVPGITRRADVSPVVRDGSLYFVAFDELNVPRVVSFRIDGYP